MANNQITIRDDIYARRHNEYELTNIIFGSIQSIFSDD